MSIADEIEKLNNLRAGGAITEEEFQEAKRRLLQSNPTAGDMFNKAVGSVDEKMYSMLIHFSLLISYIGLGIIIPIVLWVLKKNESEFIDKNGKIVVNWIITAVIFAVICLPLTVILIGIPLLWLLAALNVVFAIIGGLKAMNGEAWPYPISFTFIK
ncbi:DUF4870 domain-containing protein [bacterium]|nr:DUF4870 domain-containing protein [bacterium]